MVPYEIEALRALIVYYNGAIWPAQVMALLGGAVAVVLARSSVRTRIAGRLLAALLAAGWLWCACVYLFQYEAGLSWLSWLIHAPVFVCAAIGLVWIGAVRGRLGDGDGRGTGRGRGLGGFLLTAAAFIALPALDWSMNGSWAAARLPGLLPDPTAVATLGLVLLSGAQGWSLRSVLVLPALWCIWAAVWASVLGTPLDAWLPGLALLVLLGVAVANRRMAAGTPSTDART